MNRLGWLLENETDFLHLTSSFSASGRLMLLIIPAIEIRHGHCAQMVQGIEGFTYSDDPVEMARLWRKENAKSLHVTDLDGMQEGRVVNTEVIRRIVAAVDIPVELGGGLRDVEVIEQAIDLGLYRVAVGHTFLLHPDETRDVLTRFGTSKIVLGIDAIDGAVTTRGGEHRESLSALEAAVRAKELGFRRLLYSEVRLDGSLRGLNLQTLRRLAEMSGLRITASGGLTGLADLLAVQELEPQGVDSVIIGRALYENRFSCQAFWRLCEARGYPYTAKV